MPSIPRQGRTLLLAAALIACGVLTYTSLPASGQGPGGPPGADGSLYPPHVAGELLVKLKASAGPNERASVRAQVSATRLRGFLSGAEHWRLAPGLSVASALARLRGNPHVEYAEPNYLVQALLAPNDPRYPELYGLNNTGQTGGTPGADIDAERAWNVSTGSPSVLVAVIDTGIDYNHPDLAANIWTNPGEIPGNGIDDDGNGFIDDVHGWDFVNNDNDPFDDNGHGTHCAGTIGAVGDNGIGVAGVNWDVSLMAIKFLSAGGSGSTAGAVASIDYGTMMGVDIMSNSWGGGGFSQTLLDAITNAAAGDIVFVAAAGNSNSNNDVSPHYPSNYNVPNVIAVAATDHNDGKASFSSFGATTVDLGAPGVNILSTLPGNSYGLLSGTSMATPHVAGAAALLRAIAPNVSAVDVRQLLMGFADPVPSMAGITVSGGRLNAFFPIADPDNTPPGTVTGLQVTGATSNSLFLSWVATGDDDDTGTASTYELRYSTSPLDASNFSGGTLVPTGAPQPSGSLENLEVLGLAADTTYYVAIRAGDEWGNLGPVSAPATGTTLPPPTFASSPASFSADLFTGQVSNQTLTLQNAGVGTLDWSIPLPEVSGAVVTQNDPLPLAKGEADPRSGDPVVSGFGGPDAFGYRWTDSDEPGGPVFAWTDIAATGTPIPELTGDDQISSPIPLGFEFSFYGNSFDTVRVSTNGWLSFTSTVATGSTSYSNQPLPTSGGPENLLAPFWDDLHFRGAARASWASDGTRFVVQYTGVDRFSTGSSLTFQVELHSSGEIRYRYLNVAGVLDSSTVGIQDGTKTDGLTVAFNTAYLHDELEIRLAAVPQWLRASPTSGRLLSGQSLDVTVTIDATGLDGGAYEGSVNVASNDPLNALVGHPVTLNVTGAPAISVSPTSLDFGEIFLGFSGELALNINNDGTDVLTVSDIVSGDPTVTVAPASFSIPARGRQVVQVTYTPVAAGPLSTSLTVMSDATNNPSVGVPVSGSAAPAPAVLVSPASFNEALFTGGSVGRNLRIRNTGGSNLEVDLSVNLGGATAAATESWVELPKGDESDTGSGDAQIERTGGPDAFGYRFADSDSPGGPVFDWVDISSIGTPITALTGDDQNAGPVPIGFNFPFYGNSFSTIRVCTNGWLSFTSTRTTTSNPSSLPNTGTTIPENLIAPFFDDLHFRSVARARYHNDGSRFIVQYTGVDRFSTGSNLTFQVILYPNGDIVYQYLSMSGVLNSATIGIQNANKTIGLLVSANENYVHNNMAIRISRVPDWLAVAPTSGTIPPGGFQDFAVTFNAGDSGDRVFQGAVHIETNIPDPSFVDVPATLTVFGVADVATSPTSVDFGTRFTGFPALIQLAVQNVGTGALIVTQVTSSDPELLVEEPPSSGAVFNIPPGGEVLYNLRWLPVSPRTLNAVVTVHSDDPDEPTLQVPVLGTSIPAPVLGFSPGSFSGNLFVGQQESRTLTLTNTGGSNLNYNLGVRLSNALVVPQESKDLLKGEEPESTGPPVTLGSGGPDMFGYRWKDSDEPGGPLFDWFDISGIGTPVPGLDSDDENVGPIDIGFSFPFYGNTFDTVRVCTNGWVSFTSTLTRFSNASLPTGGTTNPENLLAAFWDDLHFRSQERATTYNDGSRFIIQFTDVDRIGTTITEHYTFQIILYPSGKIVYQYLTMDGPLDSATIGIQNATRDDGLTVVHNAAYVHDNLAIEIQAIPDWLSVSPASGVIPAGGSQNVTVLLSAVDLIGGTYQGGLTLTTNDPVRPLVNLPASLFVTGFPEIAASPSSLDFGTVFVGVSAQDDVTLTNTGSDVLQVGAVSVSGDYSTDTSPFVLGVGESRTLSVQFAPAGDGPRSGSLVVESNATSTPTLTVPLSGQGLFPPVASVNPASLEVTLPPNGTTNRAVRLSNTGASDLEWDASVALLITGTSLPPSWDPLPKADESANGEGVGIERVGGPDAYGYQFRDSDEPGGPVFNWVDISTVGVPVAGLDGDDENAGPVPIGFSFPFYGNNFSTVNICTNGWLSFTSTRTSFSNPSSLPNTGSSVPENLLAPFWDDLHFRGTERVTTLNDGTRFIVQFTNVDRFSTGSDLTFQVILYPNGHIVYQYLTMSGVLNSATVGIQNGDKTIGLLTSYNEAYIHDAMAIEFVRTPDWLVASPASGVIPAGGFQDINLAFNAAGLDDGDHEAVLTVASNDPFNSPLDVPVLLHVGEVDLDYVLVEPNTLNLSSNGKTVRAALQLPPAYSPSEVVISSVSLFGQLFANPSPVSYEDSNGDGIQELVLKFNRSAFEALVPEGDDVPVVVTGEVRNKTWFRGMDTVRTIRPRLVAPNGGEYLIAGTSVNVNWNPPVIPVSTTYSLWLSVNGGDSWQNVASGLTGTSYTWTVPAISASTARLRVYVSDSRGVMGYDTSDGSFVISGALYAPRPVDTLAVGLDPTSVVLQWKVPAVDSSHGPAASYRVLRSTSGPQAFQEIGSVTADNYRDPLAGQEGSTIIYYKVISTNAAGDAAE